MRKEKFVKTKTSSNVSEFKTKSKENERISTPYHHVDSETSYKRAHNTYSKKWFTEFKHVEEQEGEKLLFEEIQKLKKEASFIFNDAATHNKSKAPKSLSPSDYAWVKTVMSKGTKTDKVAAYTLIIQDSPIYNLGLLKNMVEMVKVGKKKECFMAIDALCELFLNELLPPNRKLISFIDQPLSKLNDLTSGNTVSRNRRLLLWYFEDQLKSTYRDFVNHLTKIAYDSVEANKQKVITALYKLLEGNSEIENVILDSIVNKLGDPSKKVASKTIYVLIKLLQTHPNMKGVIADAVEKVIFRNNISKRAQYYSVCFLSQFCLFNGDNLVAQKLISIYLSLFKACIKTGEIDSRIMSALLAGVNRAFPYIKEVTMIQDHINTLYKIIHLSHANIAIQALSILHLISNNSGTCTDRFYSVLYKKIGEVGMFQSTHHAMLINLIFKALKKDKENNRICAFIKRLLQICAYITVPVACGVLIMISQILKCKDKILLEENIPSTTVKIEIDSDNEEEYYQDVTENVPPSERFNLTKDKKKIEEEKEKSPIYLTDVKKDVDEKNIGVWSNPDKSVDYIKAEKMQEYNSFARNPLYAGAQNCLCYELFELVYHFHPTVSLFAQKIINGEVINYSGDPFLDFTLIRFLDKFSFKNPKEIKPEEERNVSFVKFNRKKYYSAAPIRRLRANTMEYLKLNESSIPADEIFLYRFMKQKMGVKKGIKKENIDTSDAESINSDEFDNLMSDIIEGKNDEIDFHNEVGQLPKSDKNKKFAKRKAENESHDFDDSDVFEETINESDDDSFAEDFDGDEFDDDAEDEDDDENLGDSDLENDAAELEASGFKLPNLPCLEKGNLKRKRKLKTDFKKGGLFASAEEFAEVLEEDDYNNGGSEALSNKDRAALKQLKWESLRDKWINKKDFRKKSFKRVHHVKSSKNSSTGFKKKRF